MTDTTDNTAQLVKSHMKPPSIAALRTVDDPTLRTVYCDTFRQQRRVWVALWQQQGDPSPRPGGFTPRSGRDPGVGPDFVGSYETAINFIARDRAQYPLPLDSLWWYPNDPNAD